MRVFFIVMFIFIGRISAITAQTESDTLIAYKYYQKADSLLDHRKHEESIGLLRKAIKIYENVQYKIRIINSYNKISKNQLLLFQLEESYKASLKALNLNDESTSSHLLEKAISLDHIGDYFFLKTNYESALEHFKKSLELKQHLLKPDNFQISNSLNNLGLIYRAKGEYEKALTYFQKALGVGLKSYEETNEKLAKFYNNIASLYYTKGDFEGAIKYVEKAMAINVKKYGVYHIAVAPYYNNLGAIYKRNGLLNKAIEYYERTLKIVLEALGNQHPKAALLYSNLGDTYGLIGSYEESLLYQNKALSIRQKVFGNGHPNVSLSFIALGNTCVFQKKYNEALDYYEKALKIRLDSKGEKHPDVADCYVKIADIYYKKTDIKKALMLYEKAIAIQKEVLEPFHPFTAKSHNEIAKVYLDDMDYEKAMNNYRAAMRVNRALPDSTELKKVDLDKTLDINILMESLIGISKIHIKKYEISKNPNDLNESYSINTLANELANIKRKSLSNYDDRIMFANYEKAISRLAVRSLFHLCKRINSEDYTLINKIHKEFNNSKYRVLSASVSNENAIKFSNISSELLKKEFSLRTDYSFYSSQLSNEKKSKTPDSLKTNSFENKLFDINRQQDSLTKVLEKNYPKYHQLKYDNEVISVKEIQQKLTANQTLLEFFVSDSSTYAFTISKKQYDVKELATPKLEEQIAEFRKATTTKDHQSYSKQAFNLYNMLIAPVQDQLVGDELIIVPDESLWHLNFDLLLTSSTDTVEPSSFSYLLKKYAISYANSATLLFNPFEQKETDLKQEGCLAFSFSDSTKVAETNTMSLATLRAAGDDLPGTRKEIKAISEIVDGQYYFGTNADEATFKKNASNFKILHLALHGEVDNDRPENSKLYFTKSNDTIEDNYLYSHELFALDIPAELTVLSACNTGTGKIAKGEGIMSLGNAFQYAGTKSLLLSSWEVPDETAPQLMKNFYTNLKEGMNKSKALQQAKLQYLNQADLYKAAPFYWGGFYLVGDPTPIELGGSTWWVWVIGISICLLFVFLIIRMVRKRASGV